MRARSARSAQRGAGRDHHPRRGQGQTAGASSSASDAHRLDDLLLRSPEQAYDLDFFEGFAREVGWRAGP
jgi:hypothetical protein